MELPQVNNGKEKKFESVHEELAYLRAKLEEKENKVSTKGEELDRDSLVNEVVQDYKEAKSDEVLHEDYAMPVSNVEGITLDLLPEPHDYQVAEILHIIQTNGIKNALAVLEKMDKPHLTDDFHRFIVEFIKEGYEVKGLKKGSDLEKSFSKSLYEVSLPEISEGDEKKSLKELVSVMEQFYAGMLSVGEEKHQSFSLELANADGSEEFIFYASVPDEKRGLFEKQIVSIFPNAKVTIQRNDYNVFGTDGVSLGAVASLAKKPIYPIKTYENFDSDPFAVLLNTLSKIEKQGEGASVQFIIRSDTSDYVKSYKKSIEAIQKGSSVKEAIGADTMFDYVKDGLKDAVFGKSSKKDEPKPIDDISVEHFKKKISSPIVCVNLRVIVSAQNKIRAEDMLHEIQSAFNQFEEATGNSIEWQVIKENKDSEFFKKFSFREYDGRSELPPNLKELSSMFHFPQGNVTKSAQLKKSKSVTAPAPLDLPDSGLYLGKNRHQNLEKDVYMAEEDRLRHFYVIGQTGTGKSTLLRNMIKQDIDNGEGVCFIDPHGSDVQSILALVPPERYKDVVYFDPSFLDRPIGLNFLEYDPRFPEQKTFVVNELFSIFKKLYGAVPESMGPAFEQYFRNSALLVMDHPESGNTLIDVSRVLSDKTYRQFKVSMCKNPLVTQFWQNAEKTTGEQGLANYVQYVSNKFDVFLANDYMRPIIAQENSTLNFRQMMDEKKIFLVNLAKGRLGDINSNLLGLILVGKFTMAALSRVDSFGKAELPPFYMYIDEFQNFTTDSISTILAEARKYKLSLNMAHQYIKQLDEGIKNAVFGNVGNMAVFRVGVDDAEFLEKQFAPAFTQKDIMNIENLNCYVKILSNGKPTTPFNIEETFPPTGDREVAEKLKELSYLTYGRDRATVEESIMKKYKKAEII